MMWWNHGGWSAGDWLAMSLMMLVFFAMLITLAVWLVRSLRNEPRGTNRAQRPVTGRGDEVLAERFARGEIDEAEFARRREILHATTTGRS